MKHLARRVMNLERIELIAQTVEAPWTFRIGSIKKLPPDYVGERHIAVIRRLESPSPGMESCEMEERPGPPPVPEKNVFTIRLVEAPESCA